MGNGERACVWSLREEEVFRLLLCEQVDILVDRRFRSLRFQVAQHFSIVHGDGGRYALHLHEVRLAVALRHKLCGGVLDVAHVDREDGHGASRDGDAWELHTTGSEPHVFLRREVGEALVVVDEDEGRTAVSPDTPPQLRVLPLLEVLGSWELRLHGCEELSKVLHEEVERAESVERLVLLSELTEGSLKVVGADGQVVVGRSRRGLHLVEGVQFPFRVGPPVVHVVAEEVASASQFHHGE